MTPFKPEPTGEVDYMTPTGVRVRINHDDRTAVAVRENGSICIYGPGYRTAAMCAELAAFRWRRV